MLASATDATVMDIYSNSHTVHTSRRAPPKSYSTLFGSLGRYIITYIGLEHTLPPEYIVEEFTRTMLFERQKP